MGSLYVAVAHTGRTLQLGVQPSQRVDAVQQALVAFAGVPVADQILMLAGTKLDPARPLAAYKLPMEDAAAAADEPVYLYCKSHLRPGSAAPQPDALPAIVPQVPPALGPAAVATAVAAHPLAQAPQPVVRDLPRHELAFAHHVASATVYWDASSARLQRCRQLLSEQEVQSRGADAATVNVEAHYRWITASMTAFMQRYQQQCAQHAQLLSSFSDDQALLDSISLPPALQVGGVRTLAALPAAVKAREVAANCRKYHAQFADKVSQLESLYESLKLDMEALIMQAPSVDLDALGMQLAEAEGWQEEQAAILQVLSKDLATLQQLVEQLVRRSAGAGGLQAWGTALQQAPQHQPQPATSAQSSEPAARSLGSASGPQEPGSQQQPSQQQPAQPQPQVHPHIGLGPHSSMRQLLDACGAVTAMAGSHESQQLPRMAALDACMAVLEEKCVAAKQQMTADVVAMLQRISLQQSKIRDMRGRLAGFESLLQRQAGLFAELRPLGRLSAAYRALLAECERRRAWHQLKTCQAAEFVEQLVAQYQKEAAKRQTFVHQVGRYLPAEMLSAAGLSETGEPLPLPTVTVPPAPGTLLPVSLHEVSQIPRPPARVSLTMAAMSRLLHPPASPSEGQALHAATREGSLEARGTTTEGEGEGEGPAYAPPLPDPTSMHRLEMENARLRAELADHIAQASLALLSQQLHQQALAGAAGQAGPAATPPAAAGGMSTYLEAPHASHAALPGVGAGAAHGAPPHPTHSHSSSDGAALAAVRSAGGVGTGPNTPAATPRHSQPGHPGGPASGQLPTASGQLPVPASPALLGRSASGSNWRRQPSGGLGSGVGVSGSPAAAPVLHSTRSLGSAAHPLASHQQPSASSSPTTRPPLHGPPLAAGARSPQVSGPGAGGALGATLPGSGGSRTSSTLLPLHSAASMPAQIPDAPQPTPSAASSTALGVPDTPSRAAPSGSAGLPHSLSGSRINMQHAAMQQGGSASASLRGGPPSGASHMMMAMPASPSGMPPLPSLGSTTTTGVAVEVESQVVSALKHAVSMKEEYCAALQYEVRALNDRVGVYEERIQRLEQLLAQSQLQQPHPLQQQQQLQQLVGAATAGQPRALQASAWEDPQPAAPSGSDKSHVVLPGDVSHLTLQQAESGERSQGALPGHASPTAHVASIQAAAGTAGGAPAASQLHVRKLLRQSSDEPLMSDSSFFEATAGAAAGSGGDVATVPQLPLSAAPGAVMPAPDNSLPPHALEAQPARHALTEPPSPATSLVSVGAATTGRHEAAGHVEPDHACTPASGPRPASSRGWATPSPVPHTGGTISSSTSGGGTIGSTVTALGPIALAALGCSRAHTPEPSVEAAAAPTAMLQPPPQSQLSLDVLQQVAAAGPLPLLLGAPGSLPGAGSEAAGGSLWHLGPFEAMPDIWGTHPLFRGRWGLEPGVSPAAGAAAAAGAASSSEQPASSMARQQHHAQLQQQELAVAAGDAATGAAEAAEPKAAAQGDAAEPVEHVVAPAAGEAPDAASGVAAAQPLATPEASQSGTAAADTTSHSAVLAAAADAHAPAAADAADAASAPDAAEQAQPASVSVAAVSTSLQPAGGAPADDELQGAQDVATLAAAVRPAASDTTAAPDATAAAPAGEEAAPEATCAETTAPVPAPTDAASAAPNTHASAPGAELIPQVAAASVDTIPAADSAVPQSTVSATAPATAPMILPEASPSAAVSASMPEGLPARSGKSAAAEQQQEEEEEEEPVPDIDEVFATPAAADATAAGQLLLPGNASAAAAAMSHEARQEARTWPAAGSGLGASMLGFGSSGPTEPPRVHAGFTAGPATPEAGHAWGGAGDEGSAMTRSQQQAAEAAAAGGGDADEGPGGELQGSMYASAMASTDSS